MKLSLLENHVLENLRECGCDVSVLAQQGCALGAAVSGGADSVCMLLCLAHICSEYNCSLKVITVDHKIRSEEESSGDARFVSDLCEKLKKAGLSVDVYVHELKPGEVFSVAERRKNGIEEAARFLRYESFYGFSRNHNVPFVCLAHNLNDQLETAVMRFLHGSGSAGMAGIRARRDIFVRPLLDVGRTEIELYLTENNRTWRTDITNFDEHYLRNRIRHSLIPLLDEKFPGWKKSVAGGCRRFSIDEDFFDSQCAGITPELRNDSCVKFSRNVICPLHEAVSVRVVFRTIAELNSCVRFPFPLVDGLLKSLKKGKDAFCVESSGVCVGFDKRYVYIKLKENIATDSAFFAIIRESGCFEFSFGTVDVYVNDGRASVELGNIVLSDIPVPFCIRSRQIDDRIKAADGSMKLLADFLSDSHVPAGVKSLVPVIQELLSDEQEIVCVAGSVLGYKDWIVRT